MPACGASHTRCDWLSHCDSHPTKTDNPTNDPDASAVRATRRNERRHPPWPARSVAVPMSGLASKWLTRLEQFTPLADEDRRLLEDIAEKTHQVVASDLRKVGDPIERFHVVLEGIVCQYQILP